LTRARLEPRMAAHSRRPTSSGSGPREARVHPERPASALRPDAVERLHRAMRRILAAAVAAGGSTLSDDGYTDADGNAGDFQFEHKGYGRTGEPCLACGAPIRRAVVGGRSSHFCPRCQRRPARRSD